MQNHVTALLYSILSLLAWFIYHECLQCRHLRLMQVFYTLEHELIAFIPRKMVLTWSDKKKLQNWTNIQPNTTKKQRLIQFSFTTWTNSVGRFLKSIQIANRTNRGNLLFLASSVWEKLIGEHWIQKKPYSNHFG